MDLGRPFVIATLSVIDVALSVIEWIILVWVILSWILFFARQSSFRWKHRSFYDTLDMLNEILERGTRPILRPFRRILPPSRTGGIDWSPLLLLLAIYFVRTFLALAFRPIL
jgi:YggT family protein